MRLLAFATDVSHRHGIGTYVLQTLSGLEHVRPDWHLTVIAMKVDQDAAIPRRCVVKRCPSKIRISISGVIEALRSRPNEIFIFHIGFIPLGWICAMLTGARFTLFTYGWDISRNRSWLDRHLAARASCLIAISRWTALEVERFLFRGMRRAATKIELLPPTFNETKYIPNPRAGKAFRAALGLDLEDTILLTVGRLDPAEQCKGHERVIRLLPRLVEKRPRIRYLVVGEGGDAERLRRIAIDLGVAHIIRFLGFVPDISDCYAASDLFVMPSTQEGFGIVFLEALGCGVPVVAGGVDGSTTALSWGLTGFLCDPYSDESVEQAIVGALASSTNGDLRGDSAYLAAQVRHDFGTLAFERRLDRILGGLE